MLRWFRAIQPGARWAAARLGIPPATLRHQARTLDRSPQFTAVSPVLAPAFGPDHPWTPHTGFLLSDAGVGLTASTEAFLAAGPASVYLGLGSVGGPSAAERLGLLTDALVAAGRRVVTPRSAVPDAARHDPSRVHLIGFEPFTRLFPRCRLVIHQGGVGALACGFAGDVPQFVVTPLTADHGYFGRRAHELGVAPPPVHFQDATAAHITAALAFADHPGTLERVAVVGARVLAEDGVGNAVRFLERVLV